MPAKIPRPMSIATTSSYNNTDSSGPISPPQSLLSGGLPTETIPSAPSSLLAGALPPSLLQREHHGGHPSSSMEFASSSVAPVRPRRLWTIQDTSLKHIPKFFPPLDPNCTVYVADASPSVVAIRISECFRKRSISVEYDDETITATAMTVDRCQFTVQLWKGNFTAGVDFSHGVVVECMRVSGDTMSFHAACRAILQAALGTSTGQDTRRRHSGLEFGSLDAPPCQSASKRVSAEHALEHARELLKKDRWDTQLLGMECLVNLTCPNISGKEVSLIISLQILQSDWLFKYIRLEEQDSDAAGSSARFLVGCTTSLLEPHCSSPSSFDKERSIHEGKHESRLRAVALRVLCNALSNAANARLLHQLLNSPNNVCKALLDRQVLNSLSQDLQGANRPPSVVNAGYKLSSAHEAALAVRCLRLMGEQSAIVQEFLQTEPVLERLELARACGRATHMVLQQEAERAYTKLTEDVRSC